MDLLNHDKLKALAIAPEDDQEFEGWCSQRDVLPFLLADGNDEYVLLYTALNHVYIYALLMPQRVNLKEHGPELQAWSSNPFSGWSLVASQEDVWIEKPCQNEYSDILKEA